MVHLLNFIEFHQFLNKIIVNKNILMHLHYVIFLYIFLQLAKHSRQHTSHEGSQSFDHLQAVSSRQKSEPSNEIYNDLGFRFSGLDPNAFSNSVEQQVKIIL